jgi:hypothetical protein
VQAALEDLAGIRAQPLPDLDMLGDLVVGERALQPPADLGGIQENHEAEIVTGLILRDAA